MQLIIMSKYANKKIAVLGLSTEGIDTAKFLTAEGARVYCLDRRPKEELKNAVDALHHLPLEFRFGKSYLKNLTDFESLVRTPGMSLYLPELIEAAQNGIEITSLTKIFFDEVKCPIIGVTGTKGKGTTSTLIYEILKLAGKQVYLGGNVGLPLLSMVKQIPKSAIVVLELSSFQLEDLHKSPQIAVVLRITQDHLSNYDPLATNYHSSRDEYINAKKSLVKFQTAADFAILNRDDRTSRSFAQETSAKVLFFSQNNTSADAFIRDNSVWLRQSGKETLIVKASQILLRGTHNLENIAAATLAASIVGVDLADIQTATKSFQGLEHRLQLVELRDGISYYDDSFSTTPETAIAALKSFAEPIILICGGSEKGSDFTQLGIEIVKSNVKTLILIGQMTARIKSATQRGLKSHPRELKIITGLESMQEVVQAAKSQAQKGDVVLLSPACASFGMFKNYKERGNLFRKYAQTTS